MRFYRVVTVLAAMLLLSACDTVVHTYDLIDLRDTEVSGGSAFSRALAREYLELANYEADVEYDWIDADKWAGKGLAAADGAAPEPEMSQNWQRSTDDMDPARERMMALFAAMATEKFPGLSAWAQVMYDCWLEEQDEAWQTERIETCRNNFLNALAFIEEGMKPKEAMPAPAPAPPPPQPMAFIIFFDFDKSDITPQASRILDDVAAAFRDGNKTRVLLVGHTDRAGSSDYNIGLSQRRVDSATSALAQRGIPGTAISTTALGEGQPRVPTPDGVREQENRRVEIEIR